MRMPSCISVILMMVILTFAAAQENLPRSNRPVIANPLEVVDNVILGTLNESCRKDFRIEVRNTLDKTLQVIFARSGCSCITLTAPPENRMLSPGEILEITGTIDTSKLQPGPFTKTIHVESKGFNIFTIPIRGEVKPIMDIQPAGTLDLGNFAGDVPWKRTLRLKSLQDEDALMLKAPENALFNITAIKTAPGCFSVEITPKTVPMPKGEIRENIRLTAEGIDGYDFTAINITGAVTGLQLALKKQNITILNSMQKKDKPVTAEIVVAKPGKRVRPALEKIGNDSKPKYGTVTNGTVYMPVSLEEEKYRSLTSKAAWTEIAKDISYHLPGNVTIEKYPSMTNVTLLVTFPDKYFSEYGKTVKGLVLYKGISLGEITFTYLIDK